MKKSLIFISIVLFLVLSACGTTDKKETKNIIKHEFDNAPQWVVGNASTASRICGVGSATNSGNPATMRMYAQNRGRQEISNILEAKVQAVFMDFSSKTVKNDGSAKSISNEEQIFDFSKQTTASVLSGTEQKDQWVSDHSGNLYILMCADIEKLKNSVQNMNQFDESIRQFFLERAEKIFDEISKENGAQK